MSQRTVHVMQYIVLQEVKDTHGEESVPERLSPELFFSSLEPKG
jgi:hypothetical protein